MAEDGRPSERGHWPVKSASKQWSVFRTWWELTKLVLQGRGGYEMFVRVNDMSTSAQDEFDGWNWTPEYVDWVGANDRFVVLNARAER